MRSRSHAAPSRTQRSCWSELALLHSSCLPGQTAAPACLRSAPGTDTMPPRRPPLAVLAAGVLAAFPCGGGVPSTGGAIGAGVPSFLPPDGGPWTLFEPWSDEFSGAALNATKWWPTMDDGFAGSAPGLNVAQNAVVSGGQLHLFARAVSGRLPGSPPGYANVTTAAVGTRTMRRFGYFEIRARLMNSSGIKSAFWFNQGRGRVQRTAAERQWHNEIDVFEMVAGSTHCGVVACDREVLMNLHHFNKKRTVNRTSCPVDGDPGADPSRWRGKWVAPTGLMGQFHRFGLLWRPGAVQWWLDGQVIRTVNTSCFDIEPLNLVLDVEADGFVWGSQAAALKELPRSFDIDYVRSWTQRSVNAPHQAQ